MERRAVPVAFCLLLALGSSAAAARGVIHRAEEVALSAKSLPAAAALGTAAAAQRPSAAFDALGRRFALELEPNDDFLSRLPDTRVRETAAHNEFYAGRLAGEPRSWLRITRIGNELHGVIYDGREYFSIAPARAIATLLDPGIFAGAPDANLIYRASDMEIDLGGRFCSAVHRDRTVQLQNGEQAFDAIVAELAANPALAALPTREVEVGLLGDFEFFQRHGASGEDEMLARFNVVDGIFSSQLGLRITPAFLRVFTTSADPFTKTLSEQRLDQLGAYRNAHANLSALGLTHLVTGSTFEDNIVGIAYVGGVCDSRTGAGISSDMGFDVATSALVAAHELGHNFGAEHDTDRDGPCGSTPDGYLMAPRINGSSTFSDCSVSSMEPVIAAAACIFPAQTHDLALSVDSSDVSVAVRDPVELHYELQSLGNAAVDDAALQIDFDQASFSIDSVTADAGQCQAELRQVNCTVGSIPAGETRHVTVALRGSRAGITRSVRARLTAANDELPDNNLVTTTFSFTPRVNLVLSVDDTSLETYAGDPSTSRFSVSSQGLDSAKDVVFALQLGRLTILSASTALGSCAVGPNYLECDIGTVPVGQPREIVVTYSVNEPGDFQFAASARARYDDVRGDEDTSLNLTVRPNRALVITADAGQVDAEPDELVDVGFAMNSTGRYEVAGVIARIDTNGPDIVSVAADGGICSQRTPGASASAWDCDMGTLESGAMRHIRLSVRGRDVGFYTIGVTGVSPQATGLRAVTNIDIENAFDMKLEWPDDFDGYDHREFLAVVDVTATGSAASNHVVVDVALPAQLDAVAADAGQGSCSIAEGAVRCTIGSVEPAQRIYVRLHLRSEVVGQFYGTATVTSDDDRVAANDQRTLSFRIDPAVDVAVVMPASTSLEAIVGEPFEFSFSVEASTQPVDASSVEILAGSLVIDSVTTTLGSCETSGSSAHCAIDAMPAAGVASITVSAHSGRAATESFLIQATLADDIDHLNDSGTLTVNVQDEPPPPPPPPPPDPGGSGGGGGGGRIDLATAALALALIAASFRRRRFKAALQTRSRQRMPGRRTRRRTNRRPPDSLPAILGEAPPRAARAAARTRSGCRGPARSRRRGARPSPRAAAARSRDPARCRRATGHLASRCGGTARRSRRDARARCRSPCPRR
jgi:hypothetical protein